MFHKQKDPRRIKLKMHACLINRGAGGGGVWGMGGGGWERQAGFHRKWKLKFHDFSMILP